MFTVLTNGENRLDVELSGRINSEEMKMLLEDLESQSKGIEKGAMLYQIKDFEWPTAAAFAVEFSRLPSLFRTMRRFVRIAVLTDEKWIQRVSEFEGAMLPGIQVKGFPLDERAAADVWLAQ